MVVIHNFFRKALIEAPQLVRSVTPGDREHASAVAGHVGDLSLGLHNHHHGEDTLLWDTLSQRAPACAVHVAHMREQHAEVDALLRVADALLDEWKTSPGQAAGERLAVALENVRDRMLAHIGEEETEILPIASGAISQQEWDKLGEHGRASIPRDRQFVQLGAIMNSMEEPARSAWTKSHLPLPVRVLYKLVGERQYDAEQRRLRPHATRAST